MSATPPTKPKADYGTPESWDEARRIAALVGAVPNSFSTCVRFLRNDFEQNNGELSRGTRFYLSRLLRSPSVSAPLYFAAMTFRSEKFSELGGHTEAIMQVFKPDELATLLSLVYLYRTIRKGCDAEEWKFVDEIIHPYVDVSGLLGDVMPAIGLSNAVLVGAIRPLAQALFLGVNKAEYVKYRRALKKSGELADFSQELAGWGCTYGQVASILCQPIGLGRVVSETLSDGLLPEAPSKISKAAKGIRVATQWLEAVMRTGKEPQIAHAVEFFPHADDIEQFLIRANSIRQVGSRYKWLAQGKESLTPESAPTMFQGKGPTQSAAEPSADEAAPADIPPVTDEDLKQIEE